MKGKLTVAGLVMLIGGVITFLFSFLPLIKYGDTGWSAWTMEFGLFPLSVLVALLGLDAAATVVLALTGTVKPGPVLGFTWKQLHFMEGLFIAVVMLCYLITDKGVADFGIGGWLMLLGSIAVAVGATLDLLGKGDAVIGGPKAAAPGAGTPPPPPPPPTA